MMKLPKEIHDARKHHQQDTPTRPQPQHLGHKPLVQSRKALLPRNRPHRRPRPVVLGLVTGNPGTVLDARLDHVQGRIEDGADGATDGPGNKIVRHLRALGLGLGQELPHLENAPKVARVPQHVSPHCALEAVVQGQRSLGAHRFHHAISHARVLARLGLVLEADLDEFERHHHQRFGCSRRRACQHGEGLRHGGLGEGGAVELAPFVVGGEFGCALGGFHENWG